MPKLTVLSVGDLLGEAIRRLHEGKSITDLLEGHGSAGAMPGAARLAG